MGNPSFLNSIRLSQGWRFDFCFGKNARPSGQPTVFNPHITEFDRRDGGARFNAPDSSDPFARSRVARSQHPFCFGKTVRLFAKAQKVRSVDGKWQKG